MGMKELDQIARQSIALNEEQQEQIKQLRESNDKLIALNHQLVGGVKQLQAEVERLKSANLYTQIGFVHLRRWRAGNSPEHCFSEEEEQYGDVPIYVKEQAND